jgi:hypothetical protein
MGCHFQRGGQCRFESLEPAAVTADLRQLVQPPLGILDLQTNSTWNS